jgi:hypothetical protein
MANSVKAIFREYQRPIKMSSLQKGRSGVKTQKRGKISEMTLFRQFLVFTVSRDTLGFSTMVFLLISNKINNTKPQNHKNNRFAKSIPASFWQ